MNSAVALLAETDPQSNEDLGNWYHRMACYCPTNLNHDNSNNKRSRIQLSLRKGSPVAWGAVGGGEGHVLIDAVLASMLSSPRLAGCPAFKHSSSISLSTHMSVRSWSLKF